MAVTKAQKEAIIAELVGKFTAAKSIGFATSNTLTVSEFYALRSELVSVNANYTLAKKTLIKIAIKKAIGLDIDLSTLPGQIGVVCSNDDAIAGLGKVNDLVKKTKEVKIQWAGCIFEGEIKSLEETKMIAGMPSRETLLGRMVGSLQAPLSSLARFLDALAQDKVAKEGAPAVVEVKEEVKVDETPVATEEAPVVEEAKAE